MESLQEALKARVARLHGREPTAADLAPPQPRRLDAVSVADQLLAMGQTIIAARSMGYDVEPELGGLVLHVKCSHPECKAPPRLKEPHRWVWEVTQPVQPSPIVVEGQEHPGDTSNEERAELAAADGERLLSVLRMHLVDEHGSHPDDVGVPAEQHTHPSRLEAGRKRETP